MTLALGIGCAAGVVARDVVSPAYAEHESEPDREQYEYDVVHLRVALGEGAGLVEQQRQLFNDMGASGWRYVGNNDNYLYFERPRRETAPEEPLTTEQMEGRLSALAPLWSACLAGSTTPVDSVHLRLQVQGSGSVVFLSTSPRASRESESCIRETLDELRFPATGQSFPLNARITAPDTSSSPSNGDGGASAP